MSSRIVEFYRGESPDSEGRMLEEYWGWSHDEMEFCHDFIQWMFPLDAPSAFNPEAPLLTKDDCDVFRQDPLLQKSLRESLDRFLAFLGLEMLLDGSVRRAANFERRIGVWNSLNHNWLRITRMLKSLGLLGFEREANAVWKCLRELHKKEGYVSDASFAFWRDAVE